LSLVLADNDSDYLSSFEKFLVLRYPQRFDIFSFASSKALADFLNNTDQKNILLINEQMCDGLPLSKRAEVVLMLGEGHSSQDTDEVPHIGKYQQMDQLTAQILRYYADRGRKTGLSPGKDSTRIISVCSASGGTGVSSISAGLSKLCALKGFKTFYLNLECVPSTSHFFYGHSNQSFSNVLFHLKGKNGNLPMKLESAECIDEKCGVRFFRPPESILEMNDLFKEDVTRLMAEFRKNKSHDIIFVDLHPGFHPIHTTAMDMSDTIVHIATPYDGTTKLDSWKTVVSLIKHRGGPDLQGKMIPVLNKAGVNTDQNVVHSLQEFGSYTCINDCRQAESDDCCRVVSCLTENNLFLAGLNKLLQCILSRQASDSVSPLSRAGGDRLA